MQRLCLIIVLVQWLNAVVTQFISTDESLLRNKVEEFVENVLKRGEMQLYIDSITAEKRAEEDEGYLHLDQIVHAIEDKLMQVDTVLTNLHTAAMNMFSTNLADNPPNCCDKSGLSYDARFKSSVNVDDVCSAKPSRSHEFTDVAASIFKEACQKNLEYMPTVKWQYFGSDQGLTLLYPANYLNACQSYDNRLSFWYAGGAVPLPKDVVIVIDKSSSMAKLHNGVSLMTFAKAAAKSVIDTLNNYDKFAVIAFSNIPETMQSLRGNTYCAAKMTRATAQNKIAVKKFVDSIVHGGGTNYGKAIIKAFEFLENDYHPAIITETTRVVLFMSDGAPEDSKSSIVQKLKIKSNQLNNSVVFMTYGVGDADFNILEELAVFNPETSKKGKFTPISEPSALAKEMANFYKFLSVNEHIKNRKATWSEPYLDGLGLGQIMTASKSVFLNNSLVGVVAVDITVQNLISFSSYYKPDDLSYSFVINGHGVLTNHPLFPTQTKNYSYFVPATAFETNPEFTSVFDSMKRGGEGNKTFVSYRFTSRGDYWNYGVKEQRVMSNYLWKKINYGNFSVCLVRQKKVSNLYLSSNDSLQPGTFLYHRFDVKLPAAPCSHANALASQNESSVLLAPRAFQAPEHDLSHVLNLSRVEEIEQHMEGAGNKQINVKNTSKRDVVYTYRAYQLWKSSDDKATNMKNHTLWRYIGTSNGILRLYPGAQLPLHYDPVQALWYQNAVANKGKHVISIPYEDTATGYTVITFSHALFKASNISSRNDSEEASSSEIIGVMGVDVFLTYFHDLFMSLFTHCSGTEYVCYLIDIGGYVILANDFITFDGKGNVPAPKRTHFTEIEPEIAQSLILSGILTRINCSRMDEARIRRLYTISLEEKVHKATYSAYGLECRSYELSLLLNTNAYVLVRTSFEVACEGANIKSGGGNAIACTCSLSCTSRWYDKACECPCEVDNLDYIPCENRYHFHKYSSPPCAPSEINLARITESVHSVKNHPLCYKLVFPIPSAGSPSLSLTTKAALAGIGGFCCAICVTMLVYYYKSKLICGKNLQNKVEELPEPVKQQLKHAMKKSYHEQSIRKRMSHRLSVMPAVDLKSSPLYQKSHYLPFPLIQDFNLQDNQVPMFPSEMDVTDHSFLPQQLHQIASKSDAELSNISSRSQQVQSLDNKSDTLLSQPLSLSVTLSEKSQNQSKQFGNKKKSCFKSESHYLDLKRVEARKEANRSLSQQSFFMKISNLLRKSKTISMPANLGKSKNTLLNNSDSFKYPPKPKLNNFWK